MPSIAMFYGIVVYMYFMDNKQHHRPHLHAEYQEYEAVIAIPDGEILEGTLPRSKMKLLQAWIELHHDELLADWNLVVSGEQPYKIDPLRYIMNPRVRFVTALENYTLHLVFTNGEHGVYDCAPLLDFGVFKELRDTHYFERVKASHGTVEWPHEQDICPDTLYVDSKKIPCKTYRAKVKMISYHDVEFEYPTEGDAYILETHAQREAVRQYGEPDDIEVLKIEEYA